MSTWEIMLGFEALSAGISLFAVLRFMFKEDRVESTETAEVTPSFRAMPDPVLHS